MDINKKVAVEESAISYLLPRLLVHVLVCYLIFSITFTAVPITSSKLISSA